MAHIFTPDRSEAAERLASFQAVGQRGEPRNAPASPGSGRERHLKMENEILPQLGPVHTGGDRLIGGGGW